MMTKPTMKADNINIAYIGGGSRGWAWMLMTDLALEPQLSGTVRLYDIDIPAAKNNEIIGNRLSKREDAVGKWTYQACSTLQEALEHADFVIISIMPGTFDDMDIDVHLPEKYGIYQSVGDTAGPGGIMRAFRTIPMYVEIAEAIKQYSPDAWVINYTNPMALCVRTLYAVFPQIKAFGCCHEVFGTQKLLSLACGEILGISDISREEIEVQVFGINHFTWFSKCSYRTIDLFPVYEEFVDKYDQSGYEKGDDRNWMNSTFVSCQRVKFDLFKKYGMIAAAGDRHLAEFMPPIYLADPETVRSWKFGLTTVDFRKQQLQERLARSHRLLSGEEAIELKETGEEGVLLIKSLLGLTRTISNVNIPNTGQIPNVPLNTVVETNAVFTRDNVSPVCTAPVPEQVMELLQPHIRIQEDVLNAALHGDRKLGYQAFCMDPLTTTTPDESRILFDEMIERSHITCF